MKVLREFDERLLGSYVYILIAAICEVVHIFLLLLIPLQKVILITGWSVGILIFLWIIQGLFLLFQYEDGRLIFIYEKIKYYPVDRGKYWLVKLIPWGKLTGIHCAVGVGIRCFLFLIRYL